MYVRRAVTNDAEAVTRLLDDAFSAYRERYTPAAYDATVLDAGRVWARLDEGPIWVATVDDDVVGTVSLVIDGADAYIRGMGVHPAHRGLGIGRKLLAEVETMAERAGIRRMWLSATPFLDAAIELYEAAGFTHIDDGPDDLHGTPLINMEKRLGPRSDHPSEPAQ